MTTMLWILASVMMTTAPIAVDCHGCLEEEGRCINIRFCPYLWQLLHQIQANKATSGSIQVLRESVCEISNGVPLICCRNAQNEGTNIQEISLLPDDCGRAALQEHVVRGVNASLYNWPWMALLRGSNNRRSVWICGGVLISNRYVLTAAHCVHTSSQYKLEFVRVGEYQLSRNPDCEGRVCAPTPQDILVEEIIVHEEYNKVKECPRCHDIALLRLAATAQLVPSHVEPICLPRDLEQDLGVSNNDFSSKFGWVAGWGTIDPSRTVPADVLQEALLPLGKTFCQTVSYPNPNMVVCAGGEGADSCGGDSGGPLLMENSRRQNFVVGIVSSGPTVCGAHQTQGIYTSVNYYVPWILDNLRV